MIKRTLYFGNPAYLNLNLQQLVVRLPEVEKNELLSENFRKEATAKIPVEDIGVVILDHKQITITQALLTALLENNVAVINCDDTHHPLGMLLPLNGHSVQQEKFKAQINASIPLKKNLWQQTVQAKILNQAAVLQLNNVEVMNMFYWAKSVKSGDPNNYEARAAKYYWKNIFAQKLNFSRGRFGAPPNNLLNYGYSILRALVARALVSSGLLPTLGIHHRNKYNAYCLADDIMEPFRPFVDYLVMKRVNNGLEFNDLPADIKKELLSVATLDIIIRGERSPLMVGLQRTTSSIAGCYEGRLKKIAYPEFCVSNKCD